MSLLTVTEARELVATDKSEAALQMILDAIDMDIVNHFGAHYVDASTNVVETLNPVGGKNLYLRRRATSIDEIAEYAYLGATPVTLTASEYHLWGNEGRIERLVAPQWLGLSGVGSAYWGAQVTVTYLPVDDNAIRKMVMAQLLQLELERTTLKSESIAGEYSYTASDAVDAQRATLMRKLRLGFL